jgi:hypothetical protein
MHPAPTFAMLSRGDLRLVLSAPSGAGGGGQSMPHGTKPEPGGWNRFMLEVRDLGTTVSELRRADAELRNDIVTGVGGRQILLDDLPATRPSCSTRPDPRPHCPQANIRLGRAAAWHHCRSAACLSETGRLPGLPALVDRVRPALDASLSLGIYTAQFARWGSESAHAVGLDAFG